IQPSQWLQGRGDRGRLRGQGGSRGARRVAVTPRRESAESACAGRMNEGELMRSLHEWGTTCVVVASWRASERAGERCAASSRGGGGGPCAGCMNEGELMRSLHEWRGRFSCTFHPRAAAAG